MTVSTLALAQTLTDQLSSQETNIAQLQQQLATGKVLNQPSDNPAAVTQVLALSGQASQLTSWQSSADTASSWLGTANQTANSALDSMQSAQSLLLQSLNQGAQDPTTYQALGDQLQGVINNLLSLSNTQYEGRPIFAGTSASPQAYDTSGNYLGNGDVPTVVIGPGSGAGQTVGLSVPGTTIFGVGAVQRVRHPDRCRHGAELGSADVGQPQRGPERVEREHLDGAASECRAGGFLAASGEHVVGSHDPDRQRAGRPGQSRGREYCDGHDATRFGDDQLPGGPVGGVAGHPRDPGEVRRTVRLHR